MTLDGFIMFNRDIWYEWHGIGVISMKIKHIALVHSGDRQQAGRRKTSFGSCNFSWACLGIPSMALLTRKIWWLNYWLWSSTELWKWKKGSTWASKQLRRAGAVFFHNSVLLIKMHTSKIGNTLYTEPFWKGRDVPQLNFHFFSMWGCFLAYDHFHNYLFPERGDNFSIDMFP